MSGISSLVAAQLSAAAYTPRIDYIGGALQLTESLDKNNNVVPLPSGWRVDLADSNISGSANNGIAADQFITYVNSTKQIVIAFKGSDSPSNFESDLRNSGGAEYLSIQPAAAAALASIQSNPLYSGYQIMTDGHSLGGGMAQTFAVENGLNGFGQNSLPIAQVSIDAFNNDPLKYGWGAGQNFNTALGVWQATGHTFSEVNTAGDLATAHYLGQEYVSTSTETLANPFFGIEALGAKFALAAPSALIGQAISAYGSAKAHSIYTVIDSLQSSAPPLSSQSSLTPAEISASISAALRATTTLNPDGSARVSESDGRTVNITMDTSNVAPVLQTGQSFVFDPDSGTSLTISGDSGAYLIAYEPITNGILTFSQNAFVGAGIITLPDGTPINVSEDGGAQLVSITGKDVTPEQVLLAYLSDLGDSTSLAGLDQLNFNYLNPSSNAYSVTGTVEKVDDTHANVYYSESNGPGAIIAGQPTATITDYYTAYDANGNPYQVAYDVQAAASNYLYGSGDLSQDAISGIPTLVVQGTVALTQAQFDSFGEITGSGTITAATGGTFSPAGTNIDLASSFNLSATDWVGTTLIGNDTPGQTLTASLFGNDTLVAGNGAADTLVAGEGVDTLIGGNGGDTFLANNGLTAGSRIQGTGGNNTLRASGDLSAATIFGVQVLQAGNITLTADQFASFTSIIGGGTITAATGGIYDLAEKTSSVFDLIATSNDGTTLIGDANGETLTASQAGDDSLLLTTVNYGTLDAAGAAGNDTLEHFPKRMNLAGFPRGHESDSTIVLEGRPV